MKPQTVRSQLQAAGNTGSGRMQLLAGANAAFNLKQGADALKAGQGDASGMVRTGAQNPDGSLKTNADGTPETTQGNAADKAGGIGISINVGSSSTNQSKSGSVGIAMQLGNGGGMGFTASASKATGQGAGNCTTFANTQVAGNSVNIESGGDTTLTDLQNPADKRSITADGKLQAVFGKEQATMFELAGIIGKHLS
ncbi:MAG: filamentous hemagglutinin outer membrane protein [Pseudomonadota bacterium]